MLISPPWISWCICCLVHNHGLSTCYTPRHWGLSGQHDSWCLCPRQLTELPRLLPQARACLLASLISVHRPWGRLPEGSASHQPAHSLSSAFCVCSRLCSLAFIGSHRNFPSQTFSLFPDSGGQLLLPWYSVGTLSETLTSRDNLSIRHSAYGSWY